MHMGKHTQTHSETSFLNTLVSRGAKKLMRVQSFITLETGEREREKEREMEGETEKGRDRE